MAKVLVAGLATIDFLFDVNEMPTRAEKYRANDAVMIGGGGAANAAVSIARLGGEAYLATCIGDDRIGDMILSDLDAEGVDIALVQRSPGGRSPFSSVLIDAMGERQIVNFRGAGLETPPNFNAAPLCDAILVDNRFSTQTKPALRLARERGIPGIVDGEAPVDLHDLANATHIAFSAQGLTDLTGTDDLLVALDTVSAQVSAWICVTDGANGVHYFQNGIQKTAPVARIDPIDTLGAGDVWHGAFALCLAEGADEETALGFANAAATLKCQHTGGRTGYPDKHKTEKFLRN